ncbi:DUF5704 domain-containing protein [Anaeromicropila populeti]|uniref:DUF5704 domain-containing protein n=1 Tax=Anaeromicropila populeti TaxID=37658 RepID=A0A1I6IQ60_9FIRM|nr:DUF5704 domain-containing protein [Anaeromicropila populeti]SFR68759.1 hypothetical protein SAMN05661086_01006 [Anaeromicropila populeti]
MNKKWILILVVACIVFWKSPESFAENTGVTTVEGGIKFITVDTKAVSSIRWKTVGFTVTREPCLSGEASNGGYPQKLKCATIYLKEEWKKERETESTVYVTFTIPKEAVNAAFIQAGFDEIQNNDIIYLHGIFQVMHNGIAYGSKIYDLPSIMRAENWKNPNDFRDRFDIKVRYEAALEPVELQYKTASGAIIKTELYDKARWVKPGTMLAVTFRKEMVYRNTTYELYKSYIQYYISGRAIEGTGRSLLNGESEASIQNRTIRQRPGGVRFVAIMRETPSKETITETEQIRNLESPDISAVIGAEERGKEFFDVTEGIPVKENLYVNVMSQSYLLSYHFKKIYGTKSFYVTIQKTYHLKWNDSNSTEEQEIVQKKEEKTITKKIKVERTYSYWVIESLQYYKIKNAVVRNKVFPNQSIVLVPKNYSIPQLVYQADSDENNHMKIPVYQDTVIIPSESLTGSNQRPEIPSENFSTYAQQQVPQILVANDFLTMGQQIVMDKHWREKETNPPKEIIGQAAITGENVLFQDDLSIAQHILNQEYAASGNITYETVSTTENHNELVYEIEGINPVVVHTPVICDAMVSNGVPYNQMLNPDKTRASLVLDKTFSLYLPTEGEHLYQTGYGYRDYERYTKCRQVQFPFDVYIGSQYYCKYTWITLEDDWTEFYLPIWVKEGCYEIQCRSIAVNIPTVQNETLLEENLANLNPAHYIASDSVCVEISGRLYGLSIYDISDYPTWQAVFRQTDSLKPTGFTYWAGINNQDGKRMDRSSRNTIPLVKGSHPYDSTEGILKTGYSIRYYLTTIGNMYEESDSIVIKPEFYYIDKTGENRTEVDVYYSETIGEEKEILVRIGSKRDAENVKNRALGSPFLAVSKEELKVKCKVTGETIDSIRNKKYPMFCFQSVQLNENFRTYIGDTYIPIQKNYSSMNELPINVSWKTVTRSMQKWYGEYYLPSKIYVVPKAFPLKAYYENNGAFDFKEDFWLKKGYLVVNFSIKTIQDGKEHLSYVNKKNQQNGYCNMWEMEGFSREKTDNEYTTFSFRDGDSILYDWNRSAASDYKVGGTH